MQHTSSLEKVQSPDVLSVSRFSFHEAMIFMINGECCIFLAWVLPLRRTYRWPLLFLNTRVFALECTFTWHWDSWQVWPSSQICQRSAHFADVRCTFLLAPLLRPFFTAKYPTLECRHEDVTAYDTLHEILIVIADVQTKGYDINLNRMTQSR